MGGPRGYPAGLSPGESPPRAYIICGPCGTTQFALGDLKLARSGLGLGVRVRVATMILQLVYKLTGVAVAVLICCSRHSNGELVHTFVQYL